MSSQRTQHPSLFLAVCMLTALLGEMAPAQQQSRPFPVIKNWSDPSAWSGAGVPGNRSHAVIPANSTIILDVPTARLRSLTIHGSLIAKRIPGLVLTSELIQVMDGGTLRFGSKNAPFVDKVTIRLTGDTPVGETRTDDNGLDNSGLVRALMVHNGGTLALFGVAPAVAHTTLNRHAAQGDPMITVAGHGTGWLAGDELAVGTSDFYGVQETEILSLLSDAADVGAGGVEETLALLTTGLQASRWGVLQYAGDAGIELSPSTLSGASPNTPRVLDERAPVAHLTRSICIEGEAGPAWDNDRFGGHVMVHGPHSAAEPVDSRCKISGVTFRRCGQRQFMGRYPLHWHMLSYAPPEEPVPDPCPAPTPQVVSSADHYVENSSIVGSANRAIVVHGTCGVRVENNVAVDIQGHAYFLEDGSEEHNEIINNVAMKVRSPGAAAIKLHDVDASGFWITNPNNVVTGNRACDAQVGIWNSFAESVFGVSADRCVDTNPSVVPLPDGFHHDNVGHGNRLQGIMTDRRVVDEAGSTVTGQFKPDPDGSFELFRNQVWKNGQDGYHNRAFAPSYVEWTVADNDGMDFFGATEGGEIRDTLFVAESLNSANTGFPSGLPRIGAASYHFAIKIIDITAIGYVASEPMVTANNQFVRAGGFLDSSDLYLFGVATSGLKNTGWNLLAQSYAGYLSASPAFDGWTECAGSASPTVCRRWSLAGAIHDPYGYWLPDHPGRYLVPDVPFYTHGVIDGLAVDQFGPGETDFIGTQTHFLGIESVRPDYDYDEFTGGNMSIRATRYSDTDGWIDEHSIPRQTQPGGLYPWFRYFAVAQGGRYVIDFPNDPPPATKLSLKITNSDSTIATPQDVILAVPWAASTVTGWLRSESRESNSATDEALLVHATNRDEVLNDTTGTMIWLDTDAQRVWFHFTPILSSGVACGYDPDSDNCILNPQYLVLTP